MPRNNLFKIGVAVAAAAVGAILAITSVFAHTAPTTGGHSLMGSIVKAEITASFPLVSLDPAPNTITDEQDQDAIEAAELAAKIAAEQAELAAKQAALAAEEAAEAAPNACVAADQVEDTAEKAGDLKEDATETESATEDANEKTARQAAEAAEPAETPCAGAESEHHSDGDKKSASATLSFKGEH